MSSSNTLERGKSIIILRNDGRTHSAVVTQVNYALQTVTVEWYENGETKGKEIDFLNVFALNPLLNYHLSQEIISKKYEWLKSSLSEKSQTINGPNNRVLKRNGRLTAINPKSAFGSHDKVTAHISNITSNVTVPKNKAIRMSLIPTPSFSETNVTKRQARSSVVQEVEKLKKNREERRQRQAEVREEQKTLMSIYPKNSNWKFWKMIREFQSKLEFRPLIETECIESRQITVCVRKRPLNKREIGKHEIDVISVPKKNHIIVHEPKTKVDLTEYLDNHHFYFDYAFNDSCSNEMVYKFTAKPLIKTIFEGGMATCFAYGQTGSGKTHTMGGNFTGKNQDLDKGIYVMAARDVYDILSSSRYEHQNFIVSVTFFEIYQGKVYDLLAKKNRLRVLEDGKQQVQIVGLTEKAVSSLESVLSLLQVGLSSRSSGKTTVNTNSSRSHAIFQIILRLSGIKKIHGKFSLIDLAGNERGADTSSSNKVTQMEGAEINKSLLALKECIRALGRRGAYLPFRQSKLTQVLRDSFVGEKSKTCMIAMISPGKSSCEHTLNTLRYADRVKELVPKEFEDNDFSKNEEECLPIKQDWIECNKQDHSNEVFKLPETDLHDDLMMDIRFGEDVSLATSNISGLQDSTITNIMQKIHQHS